MLEGGATTVRASSHALTVCEREQARAGQGGERGGGWHLRVYPMNIYVNKCIHVYT